MNILLLFIFNNLILFSRVNSPFGMVMKFDEEYIIIWVLYIFLTILPFTNFWTVNYYQSTWGLYILYKILFSNIYYVLNNIILSFEIIKNCGVRYRKFLPFILLSQYVLFLSNISVRDRKNFIGDTFSKINYIFEYLTYNFLKIILGYIYIISKNKIIFFELVKCDYTYRIKYNRYVDRIFSHIDNIFVSNFVLFEINNKLFKYVS